MTPPDPPELRQCGWPGCVQSFDVVTGPELVDGKSWLRINFVGMVICPIHASAGHLPRRWDWEPGDTTIAMSCECGASECGLTPTTRRRCQQWWQDHIRSTLTSRADRASIGS